MKSPTNRRGLLLPVVVLIACLTPAFVGAADWKQTASVNFVEMPWGRFAQISLEYMPDLGDNLEDVSEYMDPAKQAELMAEAMAQDHDAVGQSILITVPGLEYGMTGVWSNVRIESGNAISVPEDEDKVGSATGPGKGTNYTGELILTEFTEDVIRGSYRAQLYTDRLSMEEISARKRNYQGELVGELNHNLNQAIEAPDVKLADVPDQLSDADAELLQRIKDAGVPEDLQGQYLEMMRGMNPAMQQMILDSQSDSY